MGSGGVFATGVCNITVQPLAFALGRWIAECLKDLRAQPWEVVYHAQAADALVVGCPHHLQRSLGKTVSWSLWHSAKRPLVRREPCKSPGRR